MGGFPTKRAALLAEAKARTSRAQGTYVETASETVGSYLTAYLERIGPPTSNLDVTTWESTPLWPAGTSSPASTNPPVAGMTA